MLEDFDLLATKVGDLARLVQSLRTENQQLRAQLVTASSELETMRGRVDEASRRLDGLMERLPSPAHAAKAPWNT
jgi:outer membrane murein-binding lipoprotein Lpp